MAESDLQQTLLDLPFFAGMTDEQLAACAECAGSEHFAHGRYLFFEGDPADHFFAVREGKVALQATAGSLGMFTIETVEAGEIIGWSWMLPPYRWSLTGRAIGSVELLVFDARCLRGKCEEAPRLKYELTKRTATVSARRLLAARLALTKNLA